MASQPNHAQSKPTRFSGALSSTTDNVKSSSSATAGSALVPAKKPAVVRRVVGQQASAAGMPHLRSLKHPLCRSILQPDSMHLLRPQVPDDILHNKALNAAIAILPANYNFEVRSSAVQQARRRAVSLLRCPAIPQPCALHQGPVQVLGGPPRDPQPPRPCSHKIIQ